MRDDRLRRRRWLLKLRARQRRKFSKQLRSKPLNIIEAPGDLSLSRNSASVIAFLDQIRESAQRLSQSRAEWRYRKGRRPPRPPVYVDLTRIRRISVPAAVVLSAELQRWALIGNFSPRPRRMSKWTPSVRRLLQHLGTFALLGIRRRPGKKLIGDEAVVILQLRSGVQTETEEVGRLQDDLCELGYVFHDKRTVFEGLSEGVGNAVEHAYPADILPEQQLGARGHRWWATGCYDPYMACLRFFVYDQGVGIRQTLDRKDEWRPLIDGMKALVGLERTDKDVIAAAFEIGRSRTQLEERGKGLDQMASVARSIKGGKLRVISGLGIVEADGLGQYERFGLDAPLRGTLIEWRLPYESL